MKKVFVQILVLLLSLCAASAQSRSAGGVVFDSSTGKPLMYVPVYFKNTSVGCITDYDGKFFLKGESASDTLVVDAIGYEKLFVPLYRDNETDMRILLRPASVELAGAVVRPKKYRKKDNPAVELRAHRPVGPHARRPDL